MRRKLLFWVFSLFLADCVLADQWQERDTLVWGGAKFQLPQFPLEPLIDEAKLLANTGVFESKDSANNRGYTATWLISREALFLWKLHGIDKARRRKFLSAVGEEEFPVQATWFTGTLTLPIGEFDETSQSWPICIKMMVKNGEVTSSSMERNFRRDRAVQRSKEDEPIIGDPPDAPQ